MTKLHEIIAVESDLKSKALSEVQTSKDIFGAESGMIGEIRVYQPLADDGETFPDEVTTLVTTVGEVLDLVKNSFGSWVDVALTKEVQNSNTSANVVVDGVDLFVDLPAPALLNLEANLNELKKVYSLIPTLDPTEVWEYSEGQEQFISEPRITFRTKKVPKNHVLAEATKEHPAQVEVFTEDVRVGTWTKTVQCGMVSQSEKRRMLARIDKLYRAVKQARQRANGLEIEQSKFAETLFDYINEGKI